MKVLITGASSGIGRSLALEYSYMGYDLVLVARNKDKLMKVKEEISNKCLVEIYSMDLNVIDNCLDLYNKVKDVDILINNAGFGICDEFSNISLDDELNMIDTNIKSLHVLMKLYLKDMVKKDTGQILNVASIAGFMSGPLMATYYATKNYVVSLSEAVREELRRSGSNVSISILCPGPVDTNFNAIAGVDFSLTSISSNEVAKCVIKGLKRKKFYIVPGKLISFLRIFSRFIPRSLLVRFVYFQQRKKKVYEK